MTPKEAIATAENELTAIAARWREDGLMGGGQ
jgi:hypothetical protein